MNTKDKALIKMTKKEAVDEHKRLVYALKSRDPKLIREEGHKQSKELKEYESKR